MSSAAAFVLAAIFAGSAISKVVRPPHMTALGLPAWSGWAAVVAEIALALVLVTRPADGGVAALAVLAGFTAFLARRLGTGAGCGCFGSSTKPVTSQDLMRNALLLVLAAIAAFA